MEFKKIFISVLLIFIFCMTACAALQTTSPPTPVVNWPFDVTQRDSKVNQEFRIVEYRSYYFALRFDFFGKEDGLRLIPLLDHHRSGKLTGINIPIHIKISKVNDENKIPELIYENTILTKRKYSSEGDWPWKKGHGAHLREIIAIDLKPGIYRVEANTMEDRPEFAGTLSYLQIEGHSKIKFLPNSIEIK